MMALPQGTEFIKVIQLNVFVFEKIPAIFNRILDVLSKCCFSGGYFSSFLVKVSLKICVVVLLTFARFFRIILKKSPGGKLSEISKN